MRSRKPCLFTRFRFRGLYVGFITFWCLQQPSGSSSRGHIVQAVRRYSMITYPSVRAPVKVSDPAEDPTRPEGKN